MPNKLNWIDIGRNVMRMEGEGREGKETAHSVSKPGRRKLSPLRHFLVLLLMMMAMLFHTHSLTVSQRHLNERSELQQS